MRKTKSSVIYDRTKNVDAVRRLLGQSSVTATSAYLGISDESALDLARTINIWWWQFRIWKKSDFSFLELVCREFGRPKWCNLIKEKTKNIDAVRRLLGHSSVTTTSSYIGVTDNSKLDLARIHGFLILVINKFIYCFCYLVQIFVFWFVKIKKQKTLLTIFS